MRLKDKVAIITGGAQGLGRAFALKLASEGCKVAIADIQQDKAEATAREVRHNGDEALVVRTDVTQEQDTLEMACKTVGTFGRIDVLVNNAAIFPLRNWYEITSEEWDRVMAVNLKGYFLCSKAVFPYMREQRGGKIINMSSNTALAGTPAFLHYVCSKGAIVAMTRSLARAVGEHGINVNAIMPGMTATEHTTEEFPRQWVDEVTAKRCFKREERPEDLLGAIVFLASSDSDFMTGQTLVVDGGINML